MLEVNKLLGFGSLYICSGIVKTPIKCMDSKYRPYTSSYNYHFAAGNKYIAELPSQSLQSDEI